MGFARRVVRKSVRKATPRAVRQVVHPVNAARNAVYPGSVKQASRVVYTITNPLGALENHAIGAVLYPGCSSRGSRASSNYEVVSGSGVRAAEAVDSEDQLARLMSVERQRFTEAKPILVPDPPPVDPTPIRQKEWKARRAEVRFWQRARRKELIAEVDESARAQAAASFAETKASQEKEQRVADAWWKALSRGEPKVLKAALEAAFADNPAEVAVAKASHSGAVLVVFLPGEDVMPEKRANVTPTGRLSSKAWTKSEFNEVYAGLLGADFLATIREAWAVAPSLQQVRVIGARDEDDSTAVLFDVEVSRGDGDWSDDGFGDVLLERAPRGLYFFGRANEVRAWRPDDLLPDTIAIINRVVSS